MCHYCQNSPAENRCMEVLTAYQTSTIKIRKLVASKEYKISTHCVETETMSYCHMPYFSHMCHDHDNRAV